MKIKLGVAVGFDKLNEVVKAGYDYIEPALNSVANMSEGEFKEACKLIDASSIKAEVFNCFFPWNIKIVGEDFDLQAITKYVEVAIERAARLGAKICVVGSGSARRAPEGFSHDTAKEQLALVLKTCGEIAARYGITLVIEPLNPAETNIINTVSEAISLCEKINMPSVKCLVDFYHVAKANDTLSSVCTSKGYLKHVHIAGAVNRTMVEMGENIPLLIEWKNALEACDYNGRISIEGKFDSDFFSDISKARELLNNIFGQ